MEKDNVERVKAAIDIVSLISGYVSLKKRGRTHVGLCPFHTEKTPSFHVDAGRQTYKCFGCGKGGDALSFVMEIKGMSFVEALQELAGQAGITIEKPGRASSEKNRYYEINALALKFYRYALQSARGAEARDYLKGRGLKDETIDTFELGFAPDSWDALARALKGKGVDLALAEKCGLLIERPTGGYYDRFRNRVMFPIRDLSSEVIGFGARVLGTGEPKYLNTPESAVFLKRRVLYNLHRVKGSIRNKGVAIVEGYMDVVSLSNAGFHEAVATLGTALSEDHVRTLNRFTDKIRLVFDGDSAGRKAMLRSVDPFLANDVIPGVVVLPDGKDPDDVARTDPGLWSDLLARAPSIWDFILDESFSSRDASKLEDKKTLMNELVPVISRIKDPLVRELLAQRLAVRLKVSEEVVLRQVAHGEEKQAALPLSPQLEHLPLEETLARLMLFDDRVVRAVRKLGLADGFKDSAVARLIGFLAGHGREGLDTQACPDDIRILASRIMSEGEFPGDAKKALLDTACRFKSLSIDSDIQGIQRELSQAEEEGNLTKRNELLKQRQQKMNERKHIREYVVEVLQTI
ncbi:MAG TPA: DNA primase [Deltaproteobacteria bacterium]|nr:DNA primase [Deltaproteobacteria bacterium]